MNTQKKVVLVTGASSGIGKATARLLAVNGWTVYAAARRVEAMRELAELGVIPLAMDVTDEGQCRAAVEEIIASQGRIDALVNNAGYGPYGGLEDVPDDQARRLFDVNVFGLMALTRLVLPLMRAKGRGRIVNVSSIGGRLVTLMNGWYHASKFALEALSDALRTEVKGFGIEVVVIEPGNVLTEMSRVAKDSLLAVSGDGPYQGLAKGVAGVLESAVIQGNGPFSPVAPEVIARVIWSALKADRPKTRYAAPCHAKLLLFLRWLLPDRCFDAMLMKQLAGLDGPKKCRLSPCKCCKPRGQAS